MNRSVLQVVLKRTTLVVAGLAILAAAPACRKEPPVPSGPAVSREYPNGRCDVTISGAVQATFSSAGGSSNVASVYWMTDDELRRYFTWQAREETKLQVAEEDIGYFVDQAMSKNPRFTPLLIRCPSPAATVTLLPGKGSRYEDVPFRPTQFKIAPAFRVEDAVPGLFAAQSIVIIGQEAVKFKPTEYGVLNVTAFDEVVLAGDFSYTAAAPGRTITVSGKFNFKRPRPVVAASAR